MVICYTLQIYYQEMAFWVMIQGPSSKYQEVSGIDSANYFNWVLTSVWQC